MNKKSALDMPVAMEYKPRLHLDLPKKDLDVVEKLRVGKKVTFTVTGEVVSVESRENVYNGKKEEHASFCVEGYKLKFNPDNLYAALSEDDE